jgi:hypothetical protein
MNLVQSLLKDGVGRRFLAGAERLGVRFSFLEAPIEELNHEQEKRWRKGQKEARFHTMAAGSQNEIRADDNYLYSTRRYPGNTANNTIGGGALTAGDTSFFTTGINDSGSQMGYFSIPQLTYQQTNMGPKGQIPKGQGYEMWEVGVAFNANAKAADVAALLDVSSLSFNMQLGGYVIYQGPIALWPGGTGVYGFAAAATTVAATTVSTQAVSNGMPSPASVRRLQQPRIFAATDNFAYILTQSANLPADNSAVALSNFTEIRIQLFGNFVSQIPQ